MTTESSAAETLRRKSAESPFAPELSSNRPGPQEDFADAMSQAMNGGPAQRFGRVNRQTDRNPTPETRNQIPMPAAKPVVNETASKSPKSPASPFESEPTPQTAKAAVTDAAGDQPGTKNASTTESDDDSTPSSNLDHAPTPGGTMDANFAIAALLAMIGASNAGTPNLNRAVATGGGAQKPADETGPGALENSLTPGSPGKSVVLPTPSGPGHATGTLASRFAPGTQPDQPGSSQQALLAAKGAKPAALATDQPALAANSQPTPSETEAAAKSAKALNLGKLPDGMAIALNDQTMNFAAEKNEIAGNDEQKLPSIPVEGRFSAGSSDKGDIKAVAGPATRKKDSTEPSEPGEWAPKVGTIELDHGGTAEPVANTDQSANQAERLNHLITREAMTIRQSGAGAVEVSLKLDSHTEISLHLTQRDGQIQASVHCDKGSLSGLDGHWGQLQESLAKHNVHLVTNEEKSSPRNPAFNLPPENSGARQFDQPAQNHRRQTRGLPEDLLPAGVSAEPDRPTKTIRQNLPAQGWEFWA